MRNKLLISATLGLVGLFGGMSQALAGYYSHTVSDFVALVEEDAQYNYDYERTVNLGEWEYHSPWKVLRFYLPDDFDTTYEAVLQLNVNSTNKSHYNAMYLNPEGISPESFGGCDDMHQDRYAEQRLGWLPYVDHDHWKFFHKVINGYRLRPGENTLLICARNGQGETWGDLDNFFLKDIVLHYRKKFQVYLPDPS